MTGMRSRTCKELPSGVLGVLGILAIAAALAIPSVGANARYNPQVSQDGRHSGRVHHHVDAEGYSPPSASIVVDGNTGKVLQVEPGRAASPGFANQDHDALPVRTARCPQD